jgi:hypothetical protein
MQWCRGWVRTGHFVSFYQEGKITARLKRRVRKIRIKRERKVDRDQSSEYLRHGNRPNSCIPLSAISCILHRTISSQSWVSFLFVVFSCVSIFNLYFFFYLLLASYCWMVMFEFINCLVNYAVVLLLGVVSLMAGSATGVPMSPGYGGYESTTLPP